MDFKKMSKLKEDSLMRWWGQGRSSGVPEKKRELNIRTYARGKRKLSCE